MYNKSFALDVQGVSPFAYEINEEPFTGITITGTIRTNDATILDDVDFGDKKDGIGLILAGALPIAGDVALDYVSRKDLLMVFGEVGPLGVELTEIQTGKLDEQGNVTLRVKLKIKRVKQEAAGVIVTQLKEVVTVTLRTTQQDLQFGGKKP
jgi:hypothetical protein